MIRAGSYEVLTACYRAKHLTGISLHLTATLWGSRHYYFCPTQEEAEVVRG